MTQLAEPAILANFEIKKQVPKRVQVLLGFASWVLFFLGWHLLATNSQINQQLFPPPLKVFTALWMLFAEENFLADVLQSVFRILASYGIAIAIALPLGLLMGTFPMVEAFLNPLVSPFRYLPAPSFIPLLLMWLGTGDEQKIAFLVLGVIWFLITLIMDNTQAVPMELVETAKTLGAGKGSILRTIIFPAALPNIVDTFRQMLAVSWTYLVIAEIVAATNGIGAMMMRAKRFVHVDEIMAGILVIGFLGLLFDTALRLLHWQLFPYLHRSQQK